MTISYRNIRAQAIYASVAFDTADIGSGIAIGTMPINAKFLSAAITITTVFNAGTTNILTVGISASGTEIANDSESDADATGIKDLTRMFALNPLASARTIYAKYAQTGGAATTGQAYIVITFVEL